MKKPAESIGKPERKFDRLEYHAYSQQHGTLLAVKEFPYDPEGYFRQEGMEWASKLNQCYYLETIWPDTGDIHCSYVWTRHNQYNGDSRWHFWRWHQMTCGCRMNVGLHYPFNSPYALARFTPADYINKLRPPTNAQEFERTMSGELVDITRF